MAEAEDDEDDVLGSALSNCVVCSKLSVSDNRVLTEYIAKLCENTTTPHMVQEIKSFMCNLIERQNGDPKNHAEADNVPTSNRDIERHLRCCIIPREKCLNKIIMVHDISMALAEAKNESTKIVWMKLLVQTLALECKKGV